MIHRLPFVLLPHALQILGVGLSQCLEFINITFISDKIHKLCEKVPFA